MRKNIVVFVFAIIVLALMVSGVWIWVKQKQKSIRPLSAMLVSEKGKVKLSQAETLNMQKHIPVLPGNIQPNNPAGGPSSIQRDMQTINEVQRINEMNKQNSR